MIQGIVDTQANTTRRAFPMPRRGNTEPSNTETPKGEDLFETIGRTLGDLHEKMRNNNNKPGHNVEIEVRMGLICVKEEDDTLELERSTPSDPTSGAIVYLPEHKFESGVSPPDYETIKKDIESLYSSTGSATKETVYLYDKNGNEDGYRVVFDDRGLVLPYKESKKSEGRTDIQLPSSGYDLRFQASMEIKSKDTIGCDPPRGWSKQRTRRRISWVSPTENWDESDWMWQTDLTMVETKDSKKNSNSNVDGSWEVELELRPSVVKEWLSMSDPDEVMKMTSQISSHLINLLEKINPSETGSSITNPVEETNLNIRQSVKDTVNGLKPNTNNTDRVTFPGAQPVNMRRKHLPKVQDALSSYYIAEKTDGVRYLMVSTKNTCTLLNRSEGYFKVDGGSFLNKVLGEGTVLDGELVHDRDTNTSFFVAFDILQHADNNVMSKSFLSRLAVLRETVMVNYLNLNAKGGHHLRLDMKTFYPRTKIMDLFRHIRVEGRHRIFKDHKTDGVIFQPNLPYRVGTDVHLLKWKWGDLASIDLLVETENGDVQLFADSGGGNKVDFSKSVHFSVQDKARLLADAKYFKAKRSKPVIAEIALDPGSGLWVYMGLRADKNKSNFITVVMSTMVEVAEGISEDELKYRMMLESSAEDDWVLQESVMRKRAVKWRHEKTNKKSKY